MTADTLTPRQIDILRLLAQGLTNIEIGRTLFLSPCTVDVHTGGIYAKLGVTSRTEAIILAIDTYITLDDAQAAVRKRYGLK